MSEELGRIVIAGGSGFIGRALAKAWSRAGHDVVILTRTPRSDGGSSIREVYWDGKTVGEWAKELDGARAVVNLAGKNVNCRYTAANLREIDESRVDSVNAVAAAIAKAEKPPAVWVQASTTAIYGDAGDRPCDESAPIGEGIPPRTASKWEAAFNAVVTPPSIRRVLLRISFALGANGGALQTLTALTRAFLGGAAGSGKQYISWIHIDDLVRVFTWSIENEHASGVYNVATPNPVTNAQLMREIRRVLHRPWAPPTPAWLVHVGCFFMRGTEPVLALTGHAALLKRLTEAGFEFTHPQLRESLEDLLGEKS